MKWRRDCVSAKAWSVASLAAEHRRIALDADVLIYLLEDAEPRASRAAAIVDAVDQGLISASMSTLAHAEVLGGPARDGDAPRFERTAAELRDLKVDIIPVSTAIAEDAAWLRGQGSTQLVDAIHIATARATASAFVTNDRRIRSQGGLEILYLDDLDL